MAVKVKIRTLKPATLRESRRTASNPSKRKGA